MHIQVENNLFADHAHEQNYQELNTYRKVVLFSLMLIFALFLIRFGAPKMIVCTQNADFCDKVRLQQQSRIK